GDKARPESRVGAVPQGLAPRGLLRWLGRKDTKLPANIVAGFDALGLWYVWARKRAKTHIGMEAVYREVARRFSRAILQTGLGDATIVWGFNNASLELFQAARGQGRQCLLEQTI